MRCVLTIAGSDPTGGAGLQRDIETILALDARPLSVVTSITVQSPVRVLTARSLRPTLVRDQLEAILERFSPDAVKIGLAGSPGVMDAIYHLLSERAARNIVLDPVIRATSGYRFVGGRGVEALKRLFSLATLITPNLYEAALLTGVNIRDEASMREAARRLLSTGCRHVLIKGGHLEGDPVDTLFDGKRVYPFPSERITLPDGLLHGTGCILSTAIACHLAAGKHVAEAVRNGKHYLLKVLGRRKLTGSL